MSVSDQNKEASDDAQIIQIEDPASGYIASILSTGALKVNLRSATGGETGISTNPIYTSLTGGGGQLVPTISNHLRIIYSTTPVVVGSAYTSVYSRTGTGLFFGFQMDFNSANVYIKLTIDSGTIFEVLLSDIKLFQFNDTTTTRMQMGGFWATVGNTLDFSSRYAIPYNTSIVLEMKRSDGTNHQMNNSMIFVTED